MAIKELSWDQDKKRLMEAPESARASQKQTDMERKIKEKEEVLYSLQETVIVQQVETSTVKNYRSVSMKDDGITESWEGDKGHQSLSQS